MNIEQRIELAGRLDCINADTLEEADVLFLASEAIRSTMGITFGDHLIDSGYHDITPEQERKMEDQEDREQLDVAMDGISRSIQRLRSIIEMDAPPVLAIGELDLMEQRLATLRRVTQTCLLRHDE